MSSFQAKYSKEQKDAVLTAYLDRGIRPMKRVLELAATGDLGVEPFVMPFGTFTGELQRERKRRHGNVQTDLAKLPAPDAVDTLRIRLVNLAASELEKLERAKHADPEKMRQIARAVREIAALPGPKEGRGLAPGQRENGQKQSGETTGGLAGPILASFRLPGSRQDEPVPEPLSHTSTLTENTGAGQPSEDEENAENEAPGSAQRSGVRRRSPLLASTG